MHRFFTAFLALGAFQALTVSAQDPACMANCGGQLRAEFTKLGCASADDPACLCAKSDFRSGVRDCAAPCGSNEAAVEAFLNNGFCVGQPAPAPAAPTSQPAAETAPTQSAPAAPASSSAAPAPQQTSMIEPEKQPEPTPAPASTSSKEELLQDTSSAPPKPETTAPAATTSAAAETATTLATTTTAAKSGATTAADDSDNTKNVQGGLSKTAIIGIGVGAGVAGLAAIALILWFCLRKRSKPDTRPFVEISKPMPASGAGDYTGRRDPFAEKRGDVFEMRTNRYEDMLPRQEPRTVV